MKKYKGLNIMLDFLTAGESHGQCLTALVEGIPAGLKINLDEINRQMARRQKRLWSWWSYVYRNR